MFFMVYIISDIIYKKEKKKKNSLSTDNLEIFKTETGNWFICRMTQLAVFQLF
jgi:hypothetical protein